MFIAGSRTWPTKSESSPVTLHSFGIVYLLRVRCETISKVNAMLLALAGNYLVRPSGRLNQRFSVGLKWAFTFSKLPNKITVALCLMATTISPALCQDVRVGDLIIHDARIRATPPEAPVAGGYLTIINLGSKRERLIDIFAPFAAKTEIHEMKVENNIMRMRRIEGGIEIPADGSVTLKPGGRHIMFIQLKEQLTHGEQRPVSFVFERHGVINIQASVQDIGKEPDPSLQKNNSVDHSHH